MKKNHRTCSTVLVAFM